MTIIRCEVRRFVGLGGPLESLALNGILQLSGERFPDELFERVHLKPIPEDLEQVRKTAKAAVKTLRAILKDAKADLSASVHECNQLDVAIDVIEEKLNDLLPPMGAPVLAKLPFDE